MIFIENLNFSVNIPSDDDGFILLQCPKCREKFKLYCNDLKSNELINIYCPSCGLIIDNYFTDEVVQLVHARALNQINSHIDKKFKKISRQFKNSPIEFKYDKFKKIDEIEIKSKIDTMQSVYLDCCDKNIKIRDFIIYSKYYCPFCGGLVMEINEKNLKILMRNFRSKASRILSAPFGNYSEELSKFIDFLDKNTLIHNYIKSCGEAEYNIEEEVIKVANSCGRLKFSLGSDDRKEVANIYHIIKYLAKNKINGFNFVYWGYSSSKGIQDKVNGFGNEFINILITHIENYLMEVAIEMESNDKNNINNITLENSNNVQIAFSNTDSIIANTINSDEQKELKILVEKLKSMSDEINDENKQDFDESLEVIETFDPKVIKKSVLKMALKTLKAIPGVAEFTTAVSSIIEFFEKVHNIIL